MANFEKNMGSLGDNEKTRGLWVTEIMGLWVTNGKIGGLWVTNGQNRGSLGDSGLKKWGLFDRTWCIT